MRLFTDVGAGGFKKVSPLPKICLIYFTIMKLDSYTLLKENTENVWIKWPNPWVLLASAFFNQKPANFAVSRSTDILCMLVHNFNAFNFFQPFNNFLINMATMLIKSERMAALGPFKIRIFFKTFVHDITKKKLLHDIILKMCSCEHSLVILAFLWQKLSSSEFYRNMILT